MKRRTGTLTVQGDDNRNYTIHVYTDFIDVGTRGDLTAEIGDPKELWTAEGNSVNLIKQGVYQILATGVILRSSVPLTL